MLRELSPAEPAFSDFVAALRAEELTAEDLASEPFRYFALDDAAWGGIGVGADALLRSVVVLPHARGRGLGVRLVEGLAQVARVQATQRLWLLTLSAAPFFERLGWRTAARSDAPAAIARSRQFAGLCPASSTLMVRAL